MLAIALDCCRGLEFFKRWKVPTIRNLKGITGKQERVRAVNYLAELSEKIPDE